MGELSHVQPARTKCAAALTQCFEIEAVILRGTHVLWMPSRFSDTISHGNAQVYTDVPASVGAAPKVEVRVTCGGSPRTACTEPRCARRGIRARPDAGRRVCVRGGADSGVGSVAQGILVGGHPPRPRRPPRPRTGHVPPRCCTRPVAWPRGGWARAVYMGRKCSVASGEHLRFRGTSWAFKPRQRLING